MTSWKVSSLHWTRRFRRFGRHQGIHVPLIFSFALAFLWLYNGTRCETRSPAPSKVIFSSISPIAKERSFRVIILTHSRSESLLRLLRSLGNAHYDGDRADLHVWVDRSRRSRPWRWVFGDIGADGGVVKVCKEFEWEHGGKWVHVWDRHVGIWGQWLDSYRPERGETGVGAVLLEDDLEVSVQYYRWLKSAKGMYKDKHDVFGYTLQRGTLRANNTGFGRRKIQVAEKETGYLYLLLGSWGYMPEPKRWGEFREWFHEMSCQKGFYPYVEGLLPSKWYKKQEKAKTMWTMWHIYYADMMRLYTVYANLKKEKTLASNWREPGLHFKDRNGGKPSGVTKMRDFELLGEDGGEMQGGFQLPKDPVALAWNGTYVGRDGVRTKH